MNLEDLSIWDLQARLMVMGQQILQAPPGEPIPDYIRLKFELLKVEWNRRMELLGVIDG